MCQKIRVARSNFKMFTSACLKCSQIDKVQSDLVRGRRNYRKNRSGSKHLIKPPLQKEQKVHKSTNFVHDMATLRKIVRDRHVCNNDDDDDERRRRTTMTNDDESDNSGLRPEAEEPVSGVIL